MRLRDRRITCQVLPLIGSATRAGEAALGIEADRARLQRHGIGRRPNNSLAAVAGSFGLASGGSGFGFTVPLSWACAAPAATAASIINVRIKRLIPPLRSQFRESPPSGAENAERRNLCKSGQMPSSPQLESGRPGTPAIGFRESASRIIR